MNRIWKNKELLKVLNERHIKAQNKKGIKYDEAKAYWSGLKTSLIKKKRKIENQNIAYPSYFTSPIHTYENGHLNWDQAFQITCHMEESALKSVEDITGDPAFQCNPSEAYAIYKTHIVDNIKAAIGDHIVHDIADLGCGTGETTHLLALNYPDAYIAGIDLSPNYLTIGMTKFSDSTIQWIHANMEYTELSSETFDVVVICFAFHEMIPEAIIGTIEEAYRLMRKTGKIVIVDMDSELLPPFPSFLDITEPHLKSYRDVRLLDILCNTGFIKFEQKKLHQLTSLFVGTKP
tara:strand:+ start:16895 stop:17767 length:873 start_codon:yes stop_codon:yes gene_type:complete